MRARLALLLLLLTFLAACGGDEKADTKAKKTATPAPADGAEEEEEELVVCEPDHDGRIDVKAGFREGDARTLTITKRREQGGQESRTVSTARVEVLGPRRLRWTAEEVPLPDGAISPELQKKFEELAEQVVLEYTVDRDGTYRRLENVEEVRAMLKRTLELMTEAAGNDAKALEALKASRKLLLSDAFIQASVTQEVAALHGAYGPELREGKPHKTPYLLGNPFGGEPFPARASIEYVGNDQMGCAELSLRITPDAKAFKRAVEKQLSELSGQSGEKLPEIEVISIGEFNFDGATGWMTRAETIREIKVGPQKRTDHLIIEVAPA